LAAAVDDDKIKMEAAITEAVEAAEAEVKREFEYCVPPDLSDATKPSASNDDVLSAAVAAVTGVNDNTYNKKRKGTRGTH
jgi:hypothetical protein